MTDPLRKIALDPEVSSSHHSIYLKNQRFSIVNNWSIYCFEQILCRTKPRQSEAQLSPAILTCTILPGPHLKACHLLTIELDPIERRNLGRHHTVNLY